MNHSAHDQPFYNYCRDLFIASTITYRHVLSDLATSAGNRWRHEELDVNGDGVADAGLNERHVREAATEQRKTKQLRSRRVGLDVNGDGVADADLNG